MCVVFSIPVEIPFIIAQFPIFLHLSLFLPPSFCLSNTDAVLCYSYILPPTVTVIVTLVRDPEQGPFVFFFSLLPNG